MLPRSAVDPRPADEARQQLVHQNIALVHHVARQVARSLDADLDPDELVGAGALGLMSAVDAFDVSRGHAFSTFAIPRIRGAMLDELRRQAPSSRSTRRKARAIASARAQVAEHKGAAATARELAESLGVDLQTYWQWERDVDGSIQIPLSHVDEESESSVPLLEMVAASDAEDLESRLTRERQVEAMKDALMELNENERIVVTLNYYEDLRLREIAEILGLTESRVSQIRTRALAKLRKTMTPFR
jgi:RNA polymerase sigma factor for flagellar operon FliA